MINRFKNGLIILMMVATLILIMTSTEELIGAVNKAVTLWATRLFPILFPFYILGVLFVKLGVAHFIGSLISPITQFLFRVKPISGFVLLISLLAGNPQSAVMITELINRGELTKAESEHLLKFSVFNNPLFCIGTIGIGYFHNVTIGYIILISHILANICLGIILRFRIKKKGLHPISVQLAYRKMVNSKTHESFGDILTSTIQKGMNIMFLICGLMIFFNVLIVIMVKSHFFHLVYFLITLNGLIEIPYDIFSAVMIGFFELTSFIDAITKTNLNLRLMVTIITVFVSFGGLSIHSQIRSVLNKVKINYKQFFLFRIYQMIIGGIITYFLFPIFYKENTKTTGGFSSYTEFRQSSIAFSILLLLLLIILVNRKRPLV